ncbi:MAG: metalloregulator ArsR/SmtB family transcription factor [Actinomycetota bacterium]|nr:metalloregulator ArsR/SmtB family transcription factor [Actinomycetota bacterium]
MTMKAVATAHTDEGVTALFHALSDPSRLTILRHLFLGEHRVVDLVAHLGLAQSTVSQHLACLRDCGLVTSRPVGRSSMFTLTQPDLVATLLAQAEHLLTATGDAAAAHDLSTRH